MRGLIGAGSDKSRELIAYEISLGKQWFLKHTF